MDEWCIEQHGKSGLTRACLESPHGIDDVSSAVLGYIQRWIPEKRTGVLAGNSVHADRFFLAEEMPRILDWLHYSASIRLDYGHGLNRKARCVFSQGGHFPRS
ncbi:hypothetical protein J3R82DRAFT_6773 [Butyriboletus roseoflavus]|nr:hypothetical protein J3R82DRAFT_6773 [Butyriboletus roseoflavus]